MSLTKGQDSMPRPQSTSVMKECMLNVGRLRQAEHDGHTFAPARWRYGVPGHLAHYLECTEAWNLRWRVEKLRGPTSC